MSLRLDQLDRSPEQECFNDIRGCGDDKSGNGIAQDPIESPGFCATTKVVPQVCVKQVFVSSKTDEQGLATPRIQGSSESNNDI